MKRDEIENGLTFLGFVVMENKLKEGTRDVIETLQLECGVETIMATGDNINIAISVAS